MKQTVVEFKCDVCGKKKIRSKVKTRERPLPDDWMSVAAAFVTSQEFEIERELTLGNPDYTSSMPTFYHCCSDACVVELGERLFKRLDEEYSDLGGAEV